MTRAELLEGVGFICHTSTLSNGSDPSGPIVDTNAPRNRAFHGDFSGMIGATLSPPCYRKETSICERLFPPTYTAATGTDGAEQRSTAAHGQNGPGGMWTNIRRCRPCQLWRQQGRPRPGTQVDSVNDMFRSGCQPTTSSRCSRRYITGFARINLACGSNVNSFTSPNVGPFSTTVGSGCSTHCPHGCPRNDREIKTRTFFGQLCTFNTSKYPHMQVLSVPQRAPGRRRRNRVSARSGSIL